jgi:hypothetical protein
MSELVDLWPDFTAQKIRTPKAVLREQAEELGRKTRNLVLGETKTNKIPLGKDKEELEKYVIGETLNLIVPSLDNYRYRLLELYHSPTLVYPLSTSWHLDGGEKINNEEELKRFLQKKFSSSETVTIIQALIAQAIEGVES